MAILRSIKNLLNYNPIMGRSVFDRPAPSIPPPLPSQPAPVPPVVQQQQAQVAAQKAVPPQQRPVAPQRQVSPQPEIPQPGAFQPQEEQLNPIDKYNLALMDMLKISQQGGNTEDIFKQQFALQRARSQKISEITPEEQRVLSPAQQAAIRSGESGALEPQIDEIAARIKMNDVRLQNFEKLLSTAREFGKDFAASVAPTKEVIEGYKQMIRAGGNPTSIPDSVRGKVMSQLTTEDWDLWGTENRKGATTSSGLNLYQQANLETKISNDFERHVADARTAIRNKSAIDSGYNAAKAALASGASLNAPSQAMIFGYNKILDAASVVRESEYSRTAEGQSLLNRVEAAYQKLVQGGAGVTITDLEGIKNMASELIINYENYIRNQAQKVKNQAEGYGLDINRILTPQDIELLEEKQEAGDDYQKYLQAIQ